MLDTYFYSLFYKYVKILYKANDILENINNLEKNMSYDKLGNKLNPLEEEFINLTFIVIRIISIKRCGCDNYIIDKNSGLIQMASHNRLIEIELSKIKEEYGEVFDIIKKIRNKMEHELHHIDRTGYIGDEKSTHFTFSYQKEKSNDVEIFECTVENLRNIVLELNKSFNRIICSIKAELIEKEKDYKKDFNIYFPVYNDIKLKET